ncbi:hypothetical protein BD779DRAFT_1671176 [Infundibulicybe gibba]|nr:hypothetical protein BD779DRAFT_1671176 [Infundibulicybe gibba]
MSSPKSAHQAGPATSRPPAEPSYFIRIHLSDNAYRVVLIDWDFTVADLIIAFGQKLNLSKQVLAAYSLSIDERGTERVLLPTEWPARIIRRRSQEAGYDDGDFKALLSGKDASFMFKFTFKSLLTSNKADISFSDLRHVHLTDRDLRTIPKAVSDNAKNIVSLALGNSIIPAVIPQFLSSCTNLHQLCWPNSAIHRVPRVLNHTFTIRHLDLSSNQIEDLRDMHLENMPLEVLLLQNNCVSEIPSRFSRFASLKTLNLSNNNLKSFPDAILSLRISELDLSFNQIQSISLEELSLPGLSRFLVNGNGLRVLNYRGYRHLNHLDIRQNQLARLSFGRAKNLHAVHSMNTTLTLSVTSEDVTINLSHNHLQLCDCGRVCSCRPFSRGRGMMNLTFLDISHAMLSRVPPSLYHLQGLRILRLDHNSLQELPSDGIQELRFLEVLSCSYSDLSAFPNIRASNSKLRVLDLHHNSIIELPECLWEVPLTTLNLTSNEITTWPNKCPEITSGLSGSLEELFMAGNLLMGDTLEPLQDLVKLRTLHLSFNRITFFPLEFITSFRWLEGARLTGNPLPQSPEDLRTLGSPHAYITDAQHARDIFEVVHQFPQEENISVFAIFQPIPSSKYKPAQSRPLAGHVRDRFIDTLVPHLKTSLDRVPDALRLTFLDLNHQLHARFAHSDDADALRAGVGGVVACVVDATLYVANVGRDLTVISRNGKATLLSNIHDPVDDVERIRIRAAGRWISPGGLVNDELGISRAFGFFHFFPESHHFLIIANQQFWDCVTYQVAVDIAQSEITNLGMATQKLLEMALGFGAEDGVCVMVVAVSELYKLRFRLLRLSRLAQRRCYHQENGCLPRKLSRLSNGLRNYAEPIPANEIDESPSNALSWSHERDSSGRSAAPGEPAPPNEAEEPLPSSPAPMNGIAAPTGQVAIVFTDIPSPISHEATLMLAHISRAVAPEIAFITLAAIQWCLSVQLELTNIHWPAGDSIEPRWADSYALPISMGVHCGPIISELNSTTNRMEYFGSTVNRAARISSVATRGQIMCSADVMRAVHAVVFGIEEIPPALASDDSAAAAIRKIGVAITPVGERQISGLEVPEILSLISPVASAQ